MTKPNFTQSTWEVTFQKIDYQNFTNLSSPDIYASYTHHYDWVRRREDVWLECRLSDSNKMQLTENELYIVQQHRTRKYLLKNLKQVELNFTRLALPIVLGGILCPLSILALYNYIIGLWIGVLMSLSSALLFYYGWIGTYQVALELRNIKINFLTDQTSPHLEYFITKTNQMILKRNIVL